MSLRATVVVPTTGDRGPLLLHSVGSILKQTVSEIEVFIIGDGVADETRPFIARLMEQDSRVRFFDHPKGTRRGETYRHSALAEARGDIVCYLCDRDLMLPDHVATMSALLKDADFAHTFNCIVDPQDRIEYLFQLDVGDEKDRKLCCSTYPHALHLGIPLSCAGHTLDMYRRLPHGWRTSPLKSYTDNFMWRQFLDHPECRAASGYHPTILLFTRWPQKEWTPQRRLAELVRWQQKMSHPGWYERFLADVLEAVARKHVLQSRLLRPYQRLAGPLRSLPGIGWLAHQTFKLLKR